VSAQDTLVGILVREAGKLDKLSAADGETPLTGGTLETLEILCRCTKLLRAPTREPDDDEGPEPSVDEALKAVGGG
jgi:hypothetical protein